MSFSRYAPKKKTTKTFDTKTFLFGSGSLVILLILGLFFAASLFRRGADSVLAAANLSYEKASYAQAISGYEKFITKFPNHSGISTAKIRRALARIRFAVDAQSDYITAYNTAAEEISAVENEPEFFEVSKAELSILLPKIAAGLADEAQTKTSVFAAERAELTLDLMDKLLPKSLHPVEQIAVVKARIKTVRRTIALQNALQDAAERLQELQKTTPFDAAQVGKCYAVIDSLLPEYPELTAQQKFRDLMRSVAEKEGQSVIEMTKPTVSGELPDTAEPPAKVFAVLVKQNPSAQAQSAKNLSRTYPFYHNESIYGINLTDGSLAWKQPLKDFVPLEMKPKILPVYSSKHIKQDGFILVNSENGTFRRYESTVGKLLAEISLGQRVFVSDIVQNETGYLFAAVAEDGKLTLFEVVDNAAKPVFSCIAAYQLPQKVDSQPSIDLQSGTILQFAESQTLFTIPLQKDDKKKDENKTESIISFYTGHSPLTIRTAPLLFNSCCLFVRQTSEKTCELSVFSLEKSLEKEVKERYLQTFPISGLVDCPVQINGNQCLVLSDKGELSLFEKNSNPIEPLKLLGKGSAGAVSDTGINRSAVLRGNEIWVAGNQLMLFFLQPAQSRILPVKTLRTDIETQTPLFATPYNTPFNHKQLIHCFTEPYWGGLQIAANEVIADVTTADDSANYSITWQTEVAASIIQEPQLSVKESSKFLTVYTSNGKRWKIALNKTAETTAEGDRLELPAGTFGTFNNGIKNVKVPLGRVIPLKDGYAAWTAAGKTAASKEVRVFDPAAKENRFLSISLPSLPAALPVGLDGYLLVPPENEPLMLYDVKTCKLAATFKPLRHIGKFAKWSNPAVIPAGNSGTANSDTANSFLIADNQDDEDMLYLITLKTENNTPQLFQKKCFALERPVISPLCASGNKAVFVNDRNVLHALDLNSEEKEPKYELSEELTGECIWGPYTVENGFVLATNDNKVWYCTADGQLHNESATVPVGLPFCCNSNGKKSFLINSADGVVRQFSLKTFQTELKSETGLKLSAGPVMIDDKIYLSGRDGSVYYLQLSAPLTKPEKVL